jgi:enamine deaminase RidA (YjgF/YER057c/UK114 family)
MGAVTDLHDGVPYSYFATVPEGGLVFTAGACPLDAQGNTVAPGDVAAQARQTVANLLAALEAAGSDAEHVLKTTVFVASADRSDLVEAWGEVERIFGTNGPPSTLLGVATLGYPDQLVEIEAVALRSH